jgi:hypothetical protein
MRVPAFGKAPSKEVVCGQTTTGSTPVPVRDDKPESKRILLEEQA